MLRFTPLGLGLVALAWLPSRTPHDVRIFAIQGRGHLSPLLGREVRSSGIVTAVTGGDSYVQDPAGDGDPSTSDAVLVRSRGLKVVRGDEVRFTGTVAEFVPGGSETANLSVTAVAASSLEVGGRGRPLPQPAVIGREGRLPASAAVISGDELPVNLRVEAEVRRNRFDPAQDAIDFYESLEGMLVTVRVR